jgi:hypothetical protein
MPEFRRYLNSCPYKKTLRTKIRPEGILQQDIDFFDIEEDIRFLRSEKQLERTEIYFFGMDRSKNHLGLRFNHPMERTEKKRNMG